MNDDLKELLELLNEKKVKYLVVGGYAVAFYGFPRYTGDIDIWFKPSAKNVNKLLDTINAFGFASIQLSVKDFMEKDSIIQLGYPPNRIDFLNNIDGVNFDECYKSRNIYEFENIKINLISIEDLIKNKKSSNRTKDKLDLENLL